MCLDPVINNGALTNIPFQWHAVTAEEDIKWTEDLFNNAFRLKETGKTFGTITIDDVKVTAQELFRNQPLDPSKRTFGGYVIFFSHQPRFHAYVSTIKTNVIPPL